MRPGKTLRFGFSLMLSLPLIATAGTPCQASSGAQRVALLELYTSEGCSSCPPADRWLETIASQGLGPDRVVPLALHVDYWDYIGWRDRFARPEFAARQREQVRRGGGRTVYTPQVMLGGRDFSAWHRGTLAGEAERINRMPSAADIGLTLTPVAADRYQLRVRAAARRSARAALYVAIYQNGLASDVRAGENRGMHLRHGHVVREWFGPIDVASAPIDWQHALPFGTDWKADGMGVVAFVQDQVNGEVLQALQLPFCPG